MFCNQQSCCRCYGAVLHIRYSRPKLLFQETTQLFKLQASKGLFSALVVVPRAVFCIFLLKTLLMKVLEIYLQHHQLQKSTSVLMCRSIHILIKELLSQSRLLILGEKRHLHWRSCTLRRLVGRRTHTHTFISVWVMNVEILSFIHTNSCTFSYKYISVF